MSKNQEEKSMLGLFKKKKKEHMLGAPVKGKAVPVTEVNDPTFGEGLLGDGVAVIPEEGKFYAPEDGTIDMVFDTLHAVSMTTDFGAEILIHIGLDTVKLKGEGFEGHVKSGDKVKKGQLLLTADLEKIKEAGYDIITPMVICNTAEYASVNAITGKSVNAGDDILNIEEK